jgi:lysozyme
MKIKLFLLFVTLFLGIFLLLAQNKKPRGQKIRRPCDVKAYGIDISKHNLVVNWNRVKNQTDWKIDFLIIKATSGSSWTDEMYFENRRQAQKLWSVVGFYHYYRPSENSTLQAKNYIKVVRLWSGNIKPIVDIEDTSIIQSHDKLRSGLKNWLNIVNKHYGVVPIIYTYGNFWEKYLKGHGFDKYPLWIADCSKGSCNNGVIKSAVMHQFSHELKIPGIKGPVDGDSTSCLCKILIK